MLRFLKNIGFFILLLAVIIACTPKEQECFQPTTVTAKVYFKVKDIRDTLIITDTSIIDTTFVYFRDTQMVAPSFYTQFGDSILQVNGVRGTVNMTLPLNPDTNSIQYAFTPDRDQLIFDTLTINYTSELHFLSNNCGFTYYYNIDNVQVTTNFVDSFAVTDRNVTSDGSIQNIQLYYFRQ